MEEIWKDIQGFEGSYQISNLGRVKSLERDIYTKDGVFQRHKRETIKTLKTNSDGYKGVTLTVNGIKTRTVTVHILVAEAFIPKPNDYEVFEVNHIDADRTNNIVTNLEWVTHQENINYAAELGHMTHSGETNPNYGNKILSQKYKEHPELTACCSRPGKANGRCLPIQMIDMNTKETLEFDYIGEAAQRLIDLGLTKSSVNSVRNTIRSHIEKQTPYKGFTFTLL